MGGKSLDTTTSISEPNVSDFRGNYDGGGGGARGPPVRNGSYYGDKEGTSWFMYGPSSKGTSADSRLEEGREGMQMQEWERRRRRGDDDDVD